MISQGRWGPMKQTALALSHLMATRFPQDALQIIGFGRQAMPLTQQELAAVDPDMEQGTNLQHALRLAGRHLRRHPDSEPVVLVVTDGEPTAHLDPDDGEAYFHWPPLPETIEATIREVDRLARYGATLNLFMLGDDPGLRRFVDAVARRSKGRMFLRTPTTSASTSSPTTCAPASRAAADPASIMELWWRTKAARPGEPGTTIP